MKIKTFKEWASVKGFINPIVVKEKEIPEYLEKGEMEEEKYTGRIISNFVSPAGNVVTVVYDKSGDIIQVANDNATVEGEW